MLAKTISLRLEVLLSLINTSRQFKSDEILLNPYKEIISALQYRVPQKELDKFKFYYQGISGYNLKELIDDNYDLDLLIADIQKLIQNS